MAIDPMPKTGKPAPLVILGLDVGDPESIQQWVRQGHLPTIGAIMQRGCWGRTAGLELISEQGIWFSICNGVSRGKHGYYYFRQLKPGTYDLEPCTGKETGLLPFWARFRGRERKVAIIDVPDGVVVPGLSGLQLPNWAIQNIQIPCAPYAEPPEIIAEVQQFFGPRLQVDNVLMSSLRVDRHLYRRTLDRIKKKGALCRHLLKRDLFDLIAIVFAETHVASHQFWAYRPEAKANGAQAEENELTYAIRGVYQAVDYEMGLLLAQLPPEANVFIVSSSGMNDHYPTIGLIDAFCRQLGYQASPPPNGFSVNPLTLARRFMPESWRISLSRHLPREVQERLLSDNFRHGTDWGRTTAFAIPSHFNSYIRVNLRGREPLGLVEPGQEYAILLDEIESNLRQIIDPKTGEPAVEEVMRPTVFGANYHWALPDLFVFWKPRPHFIQKALHPKVVLSQPMPGFFRDSDHSYNGFFAAAGPAIEARGALADISPLDFAPTFLHLMGEPVEDGMTGQVLSAVKTEVARRISEVDA